MKEFLISIFPMAQGVANVKVLFYHVQSSSSSTGEEDNFASCVFPSPSPPPSPFWPKERKISKV